jgi:hypothetical protein
LARLRTALKDPAYIRHKTHVQHPVRFIEDKNLDIVQLDHFPLYLVEQSARCGDQDIHTLAQGLILPAIASAAKHHHGAQIGKARVIAHRGFNLRRELARRLEHQRA